MMRCAGTSSGWKPPGRPFPTARFPERWAPLPISIPQVEEYVCAKAGLKPAPCSTQMIQRDRHAEFFTTLAIIASSIEKFAVEIRHLQRTEVLEAEEFFSKGQKGSSAMPHKRNPGAFRKPYRAGAT